MATDTIRLNPKDVAKLQLLDETGKSVIRSTLFQSALFIQRKAIKDAPFKRGVLRGSILFNPQFIGSIVNRIKVGSRLPYARIQDLGGQTGRKHAATIKGNKYLTKNLKKLKTQGILKKIFNKEVDIQFSKL